MDLLGETSKYARLLENRCARSRVRRFEMITVTCKRTISSQRSVMSLCLKHEHTKQLIEAVGLSKGQPRQVKTSGRSFSHRFPRTATHVFLRRRGDISWRSQQPSRRRCLTLGASPKPPITNETSSLLLSLHRQRQPRRHRAPRHSFLRCSFVDRKGRSGQRMRNE